MTAQVIVTPAGERMVVLPEKEYEALVEAVENAADIEAIRRFDTKLAAGEEELLPAAMANRILDGDNPIRVWREHRGLALKELAKRAGIAQAYLSQMETGRRDGSVETLRKIAAALGVTIDDLVG